MKSKSVATAANPQIVVNPPKQSKSTKRAKDAFKLDMEGLTERGPPKETLPNLSDNSVITKQVNNEVVDLVDVMHSMRLSEGPAVDSEKESQLRPSDVAKIEEWELSKERREYEYKSLLKDIDGIFVQTGLLNTGLTAYADKFSLGIAHQTLQKKPLYSTSVQAKTPGRMVVIQPGKDIKNKSGDIPTDANHTTRIGADVKAKSQMEKTTVAQALAKRTNEQGANDKAKEQVLTQEEKNEEEINQIRLMVNEFQAQRRLRAKEEGKDPKKVKMVLLKTGDEDKSINFGSSDVVMEKMAEQSLKEKRDAERELARRIQSFEMTQRSIETYNDQFQADSPQVAGMTNLSFQIPPLQLIPLLHIKKTKAMSQDKHDDLVTPLRFKIPTNKPIFNYHINEVRYRQWGDLNDNQTTRDIQLEQDLEKLETRPTNRAVFMSTAKQKSNIIRWAIIVHGAASAALIQDQMMEDRARRELEKEIMIAKDIREKQRQYEFFIKHGILLIKSFSVISGFLSKFTRIYRAKCRQEFSDAIYNFLVQSRAQMLFKIRVGYYRDCVIKAQMIFRTVLNSIQARMEIIDFIWAEWEQTLISGKVKYQYDKNLYPDYKGIRPDMLRKTQSTLKVNQASTANLTQQQSDSKANMPKLARRPSMGDINEWSTDEIIRQRAEKLQFTPQAKQIVAQFVEMMGRDRIEESRRNEKMLISKNNSANDNDSKSSQLSGSSSKKSLSKSSSQNFLEQNKLLNSPSKNMINKSRSKKTLEKQVEFDPNALNPELQNLLLPTSYSQLAKKTAADSIGGKTGGSQNQNRIQYYPLVSEAIRQKVIREEIMKCRHLFLDGFAISRRSRQLHIPPPEGKQGKIWDKEEKGVGNSSLEELNIILAEITIFPFFRMVKNVMSELVLRGMALTIREELGGK